MQAASAAQTLPPAIFAFGTVPLGAQAPAVVPFQAINDITYSTPTYYAYTKTNGSEITNSPASSGYCAKSSSPGCTLYLAYESFTNASLGSLMLNGTAQPAVTIGSRSLREESKSRFPPKGICFSLEA